MTDVDLRTFEPSWKSIPTPPSPIELSGPNSPGVNPVDFGPSTISEGGEVDLPLPEEEPLPETPSEEGGSAFLHPFRLIKAISGTTNGWKLSSWNSTITDGTNGSSISITGLNEFLTSEGDVIVRLEIDTNLNQTTASIAVGVGEYTGEVVFDPVEADVQIFADLFVGRVYKETVDGNDVFTFTQCINTAQLLTHGLLNGAAVRVFCSHNVNPDNVDPPE